MELNTYRVLEFGTLMGESVQQDVYQGFSAKDADAAWAEAQANVAQGWCSAAELWHGRHLVRFVEA